MKLIDVLDPEVRSAISATATDRMNGYDDPFYYQTIETVEAIAAQLRTATSGKKVRANADLFITIKDN